MQMLKFMETDLLKGHYLHLLWMVPLCVPILGVSMNMAHNSIRPRKPTGQHTASCVNS